MADEASTGAAVIDAETATEGLFGEEGPSVAAVGTADKQATKENAEGEQEAQDANAAEASPSDGGAEGPSAEELKVVVSIRGERAIVGVQRAGADPHIETFEDQDLTVLVQEVPGVVERARVRWEESLKHPAHNRPAPAKTTAPAKRRQRSAPAKTESQAPQGASEQQQPEALRLF